MKSIREEQGASAVEFALVASLLFLILFGTIQFGIAFNQYQGITASAREGARLGALPGTTVAQIQQRVKDSVSIVDPAKLSTSGTCPASMAVGTGCIQVERPPGTVISSGSDRPCNLNAGSDIKVTVKYQAQVSIPVWKSQSVMLTGDGVFQCE